MPMQLFKKSFYLMFDPHFSPPPPPSGSCHLGRWPPAGRAACASPSRSTGLSRPDVKVHRVPPLGGPWAQILPCQPVTAWSFPEGPFFWIWDLMLYFAGITVSSIGFIQGNVATMPTESSSSNKEGVCEGKSYINEKTESKKERRLQRNRSWLSRQFEEWLILL